MNSRHSFPVPIVPTLLLINGVMFVLELSDTSGKLIYALALWPLSAASSGLFIDTAPQFQIWQLLTYAFLHGSVMHLLLNMYALWLFGTRMENVWGSRTFAVYYFVCVIGAGVVQLLVASQGSGEGGIYPTVGASGGVFGLLLAFAYTYPNEKLMLLFPPVAMSAKWFVLIYGIIELWAGVTGTLAGIAHFAHLGGMLFGFVLLWYWRRHPPGYR